MTHPPSIDERIKTLKQQRSEIDQQIAEAEKAARIGTEPDWWPDYKAAFGAGKVSSYEDEFLNRMDDFVSRLRARFSPPPDDVEGKPGVDSNRVSIGSTVRVATTGREVRITGIGCCDNGPSFYTYQDSDGFTGSLERHEFVTIDHLPTAPRDADALAEKIAECVYRLAFDYEHGEPRMKIRGTHKNKPCAVSILTREIAALILSWPVGVELVRPIEQHGIDTGDK